MLQGLNSQSNKIDFLAMNTSLIMEFSMRTSLMLEIEQKTFLKSIMDSESATVTFTIFQRETTS